MAKLKDIGSGHKYYILTVKGWKAARTSKLSGRNFGKLLRSFQENDALAKFGSRTELQAAERNIDLIISRADNLCDLIDDGTEARLGPSEKAILENLSGRAREYKKEMSLRS